MSTTMTDPSPPVFNRLANAFELPLHALMPSPLNVRKRRTEASVERMRNSLRQHGQQQPIRVRTNPAFTPSNGRPQFEIVMGETRWRAAPGAGLQTLDAIVGEYTDHEVIELSMVENIDRNDLDPLEEAAGFDALLRKPNGLQGYASVAELAARFGHSPGYVYQRLKLLALCPAGREALLAGKIDTSVAVLIARMPDQAEQVRATVRIVEGFGGDAFSYKQAAEYLRREFMLRLGLAKFDIAAAYQVAGPCSECTKRSGAAPDLFADCDSGDMCQDARCYQAKAAEAHQQLLQAARDAGRTVLQGAKARAVLPNVAGDPVGHYRLDAPCPALTPSARPLRALLGTGFSQSIVVVDLPDIAPIELVTADAAKKAIKARGLLHEQLQQAKTAPGKASPATKAAPPPAPAEPVAAAAPAGRVAPTGGEGAEGFEADRAAYERGELTAAGKDKLAPAPEPTPLALGVGRYELQCRKFGQLLATELHDTLRRREDLGIAGLRLAVTKGFEALSAEAAGLLYLVRGWKLREGWQWSEDFGARMVGLDGRALGELLIELQVAEPLSDEPDLASLGFDVRDLASDYGLDVREIWRGAGICSGAELPPQDPTDAFVAQHGAGAATPGGDHEVTDDKAPGCVVDPDWKFPVRPD